MVSLTDFLSNLPDPLGASSQDPCSTLSQMAAPRGEDGPWHEAVHLYAVGLPVRHTCSPVTAPPLGIPSWCPDPPPWLLTTSFFSLLSNFYVGVFEFRVPCSGL